VRGSGAWQRRLRVRLLADQPFCWLAARDRTPVLMGYGILMIAAAVWLAGWAAIGPPWLTPTNAFISSIVLHQALNLVAAYAAGRRFAEERLSGGFEILLTAPLKAGELVEGQCKALLVQFRVVGLIALLFDVVFCGTGLVALNQNTPGAAAYLFAWIVMLALWFALHLVTTSRAMWISTWTGRPGYAAMKAAEGHWGLWVWVWIFSRRGFTRLFAENPVLVIFLAVGISVGFLLAFSRRYVVRQKLIKELRRIACAPIPARGDERFKKWDPDKIFPPGDFGDWGEIVGLAAKSKVRPAKPKGRMDKLNG
jgi:hypothetical protein